MEIFIVDAFAENIFEGNQAGVVLLKNEEGFPSVEMMQNIAAELKHSETAFIKKTLKNTFELKYFTCNGEVELCGHATISAFTVLKNEMRIGNGNYVAKTPAGNIEIVVETDCIWMEMPQAKLIKALPLEASVELYQAYGLDINDKPNAMTPYIVSSGLYDILLPVNDRKRLNAAIQSRNHIIEISRRNHVVGIHMFSCNPTSEVTAYCRNFAPLYGINEESATGTSTAALTYYLHTFGFVDCVSEYNFIQGETMGKPTLIKSRIKNEKTIYIGGNAVISIKGTLKL